jgi:arylsulfatase A-like enzyme
MVGFLRCGVGRVPRSWGLGLVLALVGCTAPEAPHLVLVTLDTLRADHVGVYGETDLTPNLDALASSGRLFLNAYTTIPTTNPAHASLFTGLQPFEHGVRRNGEKLSPVLASAALPERLVGYTSAAFVGGDVLADVFGLTGFSVVDSPRGGLRAGERTVAAALEWLDRQSGPVFLWVHLYDPHSPYGTWEQKIEDYPVDLTRYGWVDPAAYVSPDARAEMADRYAVGVRDMDAALGRLLDGLDAREMHSAYVVAVGDHGELLDEELDATGFAYGHGSLLREQVLRVPLVIRGPGVAAERSEAVVSIRDLYVTLLGMAGSGPPGGTFVGAVDLRDELPADRIVFAERRRFAAGRRAMNAASESLLERNVVAAMDGRSLALLAEDGTVQRGQGRPADSALRYWRAWTEASIQSPAPLDEATRERLRSLGYVD